MGAKDETGTPEAANAAMDADLAKQPKLSMDEWLDLVKKPIEPTRDDYQALLTLKEGIGAKHRLQRLQQALAAAEALALKAGTEWLEACKQRDAANERAERAEAEVERLRRELRSCRASLNKANQYIEPEVLQDRIAAALAHLAPLCESDFSTKAPGPWARVRLAVKELRVIDD